MFSLDTTTPAKLASVNCRSELHGKEAVPAVDLKFTFDQPNSILSAFDPWLLTSLYHRAETAKPAADAQGTLEGVEEVSDVPNLRMPLLSQPLKWSAEFTGYELLIDFGLGGKSNIVLPDCAVNNIAFECKEGGTVTTSMRVQCTNGLTEKVLGKLATLVQHDVHIKLVAPTVIQDTVGDGPWPFGDKGEKNAPATGERTPEQALADAVGQ
jgi:hypothetical protein